MAIKLQAASTISLSRGEKDLYVTVVKKGKDPNGVGSIVRVDNFR
jgi:hypothetical protein